MTVREGEISEISALTEKDARSDDVPPAMIRVSPGRTPGTRGEFRICRSAGTREATYPLQVVTIVSLGVQTVLCTASITYRGGKTEHTHYNWRSRCTLELR